MAHHVEEGVPLLAGEDFGAPAPLGGLEVGIEAALQRGELLGRRAVERRERGGIGGEALEGAGALEFQAIMQRLDKAQRQWRTSYGNSKTIRREPGDPGTNAPDPSTPAEQGVSHPPRKGRHHRLPSLALRRPRWPPVHDRNQLAGTLRRTGRTAPASGRDHLNPRLPSKTNTAPPEHLLSHEKKPFHSRLLGLTSRPQLETL